MAKRVLDVGNCGPDHAALKALLQAEFAAEVVQVHAPASALSALRAEPFDLVTVNRLMDADGSPGLPLIEDMLADEQLKNVPVMMITNFDDHQQQAIAAGAVQGFGKAQLHSAETIECLKPFLSS